jgi:hypothetical protein
MIIEQIKSFQIMAARNSKRKITHLFMPDPIYILLPVTPGRYNVDGLMDSGAILYKYIGGGYGLHT